MSTVRIAMIGAGGKMGRAIVKVISEAEAAALAVAVDRPGAPELGQSAAVLAGVAERGAPVLLRSERPKAGEADVWIDFSAAANAVPNAEAAVAAGAALVVGTTGLGSADKERLALAAQKTPLLFTANFSIGVNVLLDVVARTARLLGPGYDLEIVEAHHRMKRDAPSGTALRLAEALAEATGRDLGKTGVYARHGDTGPRTGDEIGLQTVRGGDVVGDHTVHYLGLGERIEITHRASSRETFARGAVRAALWLAGQKAGRLYDMRDVLGLT